MFSDMASMKKIKFIPEGHKPFYLDKLPTENQVMEAIADSLIRAGHELDFKDTYIFMSLEMRCLLGFYGFHSDTFILSKNLQGCSCMVYA